MNGGQVVKVNLSHDYPLEYYGKPGTYGTNRFTVSLDLKRGKNQEFKLSEACFFIPELKLDQNGDALSFDLPATSVFDSRHTLSDTKDFFLQYLPKISALADYLQAHQVSV